MKNKEKYAKEIVEIAIQSRHIAYDKHFKRVVPCNSIGCRDCLFNGLSPCTQKFFKWANADSEEPRFTEREIGFVKLFPEIRYIARDKTDKLFAFHQKPFKDEEEGWWDCKDDPSILFEISWGDFLEFKGIEWDDEEPTSREEILGGSDE